MSALVKKYYYVVIQSDIRKWSMCITTSPFDFYLNNEMQNSSCDIIYSCEISLEQYLKYKGIQNEI